MATAYNVQALDRSQLKYAADVTTLLSLVGAATNIFVTTNTCLSRQTCVMTKHVFCCDKVCLSRQNICHNKHMFVATKIFCRDNFVATKLLSCQAYVYHDKRCVLLWQKWCLWQVPPMIHYSATNSLWITPSFECQHTIAQVNWPQQTRVKTSHNRLHANTISQSLYTQMHTCTHTHMHTHTHTHMHTHTHTCIHTHAYTHTHMHTHTCIHTHTHAYTHMHTHTHTCIHTHAYTYIHTHKTRPHTHTHLLHTNQNTV